MATDDLGPWRGAGRWPRWRLALDALVVLALCSMGAGAVVALYWVVRLASEIRP